MPLIPGINQRSVTPDAAKTPYFKIDTTTDEFGAGIGKSMLGLENGVIDAANTAFDVKQKLAEKAKAKSPQGDNGYHIYLPMPQFSPDLSKAIEATNNFNAGAQDLTSNFLQLSGKDAVDGQADAQQSVDQLKDQVLTNASTPAVADIARKAVTQWADGTKSIIDRHATAQQRVYDDDLDNTQVAQGRDAVGLLYNDDQHYLTQLHVASQARSDQVLRASANDNTQADPETVAAAIASAQQATASDYTRTRIESALGQGDLATATALHQRWGGDLLPADQAAVSQHLTYASFNQQSRQAATQAMAISQPAPLGRQRNADMVLHRSGSSDSTGDQVADGGSSQNSAPLNPAQQSDTSQQSTDAQPTGATENEANNTDPRLSDGDGGFGSEKVMVTQDRREDKLTLDLEAKERDALAAVKSLPRPTVWPVQGDHQLMQAGNGQGKSIFGWSRKGGHQQHQGVDFKGNIGDPVYAVADGEVIYVEQKVPLTHGDASGYGNYVVIQHAKDIHTVYAHMSPTLDPNGKPILIGPNKVQLVVKLHDKVKAGQLIGFVGDTGNATDNKGIGRPQLHYEVRYGAGLTKAGRVAINPSYFLPIDN